MNLFLSSFENKIDKKGRVSVPATFRNAIKSEEFQGVILYKSFISNCIEGCTLSRMKKLSESTDTLDIFSKEQDSLSTLIFANAKELPFDVAGRIIIPPDLLIDVGIKDSALFIGRGKTFQIWNKTNFDKIQKFFIEEARKNPLSLKIIKDI